MSDKLNQSLTPGLLEIDDQVAEKLAGGANFSGNTYDFTISGVGIVGASDERFTATTVGANANFQTVREKIGDYDERYNSHDFNVPSDATIDRVLIGKPGEKFRLTPLGYFGSDASRNGIYRPTSEPELTVDGGVSTAVNFFAGRGFAINKIG